MADAGPLLEALRARGADRVDPVRFGHLEALLRRGLAQTPGVRAVLQVRAEQAIEAWMQELSAAGVQPAGDPRAGTGQTDDIDGSGAVAALRSLNLALRAHREVQREQADLMTGDDGDADALSSAQRFSSSWSRLATEQQVVAALARGPENAGPLNSHRLMLRALSLMRELSPDYLRRFVAQSETLLWLDAAVQAPPAAAARPGARPATRKGRTRSGGAG